MVLEQLKILTFKWIFPIQSKYIILGAIYFDPRLPTPFFRVHRIPKSEVKYFTCIKHIQAHFINALFFMKQIISENRLDQKKSQL